MTHIINTFYIARDGDGHQAEYPKRPKWDETLQCYDGRTLTVDDFGHDLDTGDKLSAGDCVKVTLSLTFEEPRGDK